MADEAALQRVVEALASAQALVIGAGAGMGVDSGLPDFRGTQGFWRAYPPYAQLGLSFSSLANPHWFEADPALAWGFYGHRLNLYRTTRPHAGFGILQAWARRMEHGAFVFTSNVDGQFQRAGFDPGRVVEVHGSVDWMQCTRPCGIGLFPAGPDPVNLDESTMRAVPPLPACPACGALARPNILMFGDSGWDGSRTRAQLERMDIWLRGARGSRMALVECGAGSAIPTVREMMEFLAGLPGAVLVRINPREPTVPEGPAGGSTGDAAVPFDFVDLPTGALAALRAIDERLGEG